MTFFRCLKNYQKLSIISLFFLGYYRYLGDDNFVFLYFRGYLELKIIPKLKKKKLFKRNYLTKKFRTKFPVRMILFFFFNM